MIKGDFEGKAGGAIDTMTKDTRIIMEVVDFRHTLPPDSRLSDLRYVSHC